MDATQWCVVTLRFGSVSKEKGCAQENQELKGMVREHREIRECCSSPENRRLDVHDICKQQSLRQGRKGWGTDSKNHQADKATFR